MSIQSISRAFRRGLRSKSDGNPRETVRRAVASAIEQLEGRVLFTTAPDGYTLWDTITVATPQGSSAPSPVESSVTLTNGENYKIRVSGTFTLSSGSSPPREADAEYGQPTGGSSSWNNTSGGGFDWGMKFGMVGGSLAKPTSWGEYSSAHEYTLNVTGSNAKMQFQYQDDVWTDNAGALTVEIFRPDYSSATYVPPIPAFSIPGCLPCEKWTLGGSAGPLCPQPSIATSAGGVRLGDGAYTHTSVDISSAGLGEAFGRVRTVSNAVGAGQSADGNGVSDAQQPTLRRNEAGDIAVVDAAGAARQFIRSGSTYSPRFFSQDKLVYDAGALKFLLTDSLGNITEFNDFSEGFGSRSGAVTHYTDAAGNITTFFPYVYTQIARSFETGGDEGTERLLYTYSGSHVESVTLSRSLNAGTEQTVGSVTYTYYGDTDALHGSNGDLKTAVIKDADGNTVETKYYRWWKSGENGAGHLKMAFEGQDFDRADAAISGGLLAASDIDAKLYASSYLEYDSSSRVTFQLIQGSGCSCAGSSGQGQFSYTYSADSGFSDAHNNWKRYTTVSMEDGTKQIAYTNAYGQTILDITEASDGTTRWATYYRYDSSGRLILKANPSAVALPTTLSSMHGYADLVNFSSSTYLQSSSGLIETWSYYGSETTGIDEDTDGGAVGYLNETHVQRGTSGTPVLQAKATYFKRATAGATTFPTASTAVYEETDGSGSRRTDYSYTFETGSTHIARMDVKRPEVTDLRNGPGSSIRDISTSVFDALGRTVWSKDARGAISYTEYDALTGAVVKSISDVDLSKTVDFDSTYLPGGWSTPSGGGLHLITTMEVDVYGDVTSVTDPRRNADISDGSKSYIVRLRDDKEVWSFPDWHAVGGGNYDTTGPVTVTRENWAAGYTETLSFDLAPVANAVPTGNYTITGADVLSLSRSNLSLSRQVLSTDIYFSMSGLTGYTDSQLRVANLGTEGVNFHRTQYDYNKRGTVQKTTSPTGTIYRTVFDALQRPVSSWIGLDDTPTTGTYWSLTNTGGTDLVQVSANEYDDGGIGDSNLTKVTQYPSGAGSPSDARVSQNYFDWRDRLVVSRTGVTSSALAEFISFNELNNLGEIEETLVYDGNEGGGVTITYTSGVPDEPADPNSGTSDHELLRSRSTQEYDQQGRVFRSKTYSVTASTGAISSAALTSNVWYDANGNVIASAQPGGLQSKSSFDFAGRTTLNSVTDGGGDSTYADASTRTGDKVLEQASYEYDANGNVVLTTAKQRFHDETGTGDLGTATTGNKARVSYVAGYFDTLDRQTDVVDVGTNGGVAYGNPLSGPAVGNANFETPNLGDYNFQYEPSSASWIFGPGAGVAGNYSGFTGANPVAPQGDQVGFLQTTGTMTQSTSWQAGTYVIQFKAAQRTSNSQNFEVRIDSNVVGTFTPTSSSYGHYATAQFDVTAGSHTIEFRGINTVGGDNTAFVDDIQVVPVIATRSDTRLVTSYTYDAAGRLQEVSDPKSIETRYAYDLAGRTVSVTENYVNGSPSDTDDRITRNTYDGNNNVLTMTADLSGTDQVTQYVYGITIAGGNIVNSNDVLKEVRYPDATTGAASTSASDKEQYTYNALGETKTLTDQNGNVHTYTRDVLGRLTSDEVTTLGTGVDGSVRRQEVRYNTQGLADQFTQRGITQSVSSLTRSGTTATATITAHGYAVGDTVVVAGANQSQYNGTFVILTVPTANTFTYTMASDPGASGTGTITARRLVNQVQREFNGLGQMKTEYQQTNGAVNTSSTPKVQYAYTEMASSANHSRLKSMTYPNGRIVRYEYTSGLDADISRVSFLADDSSGSVGTHVEEYSYLGLSTIVERNHPEPSLNLTYVAISGTGDAGDKYVGLDRFGRVADHRWVDQRVTPVTGTADSGTTTTLVDSPLSSSSDTYIGYTLTITGGTGAGQTATVTGYNGSTKTLSFSTLSTAPNSTSTYTLTYNRDVDRFRYAYDRDSNRTTREWDSYQMPSTVNFDEAYSYDDFNRLTKANRGNVVSGTISDANSNWSQRWDGSSVSPPSPPAVSGYDALGNWKGVYTDTDGSGGTAATVQTRTHNSQNQLTAVSGATTPTYDDAGSMTKDESGIQYTYDAWGRTIKVKTSGGTDKVIYTLDPLGRRVAQDVTASGVGGDTQYYYSSNWQVLEERESNGSGYVAKFQNVWGLAYIDQLAMRDTLDANTAGILDTTFSNDGKYTHSLPGTNDFVRFVTQSDGKIVAVGDSGNDLIVARFNDDGTLDNTFDGPSGSGNGIFTINVGTVDQAHGLAVQSDGKVVIVGYVDADILMMRLNADGTYDTTFDGPGGSGNGKFTINISGTDSARDVEIQSDGKIVIAGTSGGNFLVGRFNTTGTWDTGYDTDGRQTVDFGGTDRGFEMSLDHDGKAVVVGETTAGTGGDIAIIRMTTAGALDTSFDGDGKKTISLTAGQDSSRALAIDRQNRIVLAGSGGTDFDVFRLNPNGSADNSFDGDGQATIDISSTDVANDLVIDSYGRIVVAGSSGSGADFAVIRLKSSDGSLDATFDGDGRRAVDFGSGSENAQGLVIDPFGRIVLAGTSNQDVAVARLSGGGARHYIVQDANYNVTAVVEASATVADRYQYSPYGTYTALNADFSADSNNFGEIYQAFYFQGLRFDGNSGNLHARNRDYRASLGRWTQNDPAGYVNSFNTYELSKSSPVVLLDPFGLQTQGAPTGPNRAQAILNSLEPAPGGAAGGPLYPLVADRGTFTINYGRDDSETKSSMQIFFTPSKDVKDGCLCDEISFVQYLKESWNSFPGMFVQDTKTWTLDGADPYGVVGETSFPWIRDKPGSINAEMRDGPGLAFDFLWSTRSLKQTFRTSAICRKGKEAGKSYGTIMWSHDFTWGGDSGAKVVRKVWYEADGVAQPDTKSGKLNDSGVSFKAQNVRPVANITTNTDP